MKVVEIVPRERTRLYGMLVAKEAAIHKGGRGTYVRVGRKTKDATRWKHRNYRGSVQLKRAASEVVTAKVQATTAEDERKLLVVSRGRRSPFRRSGGDDYDPLPVIGTRGGKGSSGNRPGVGQSFDICNCRRSPTQVF